MLLFPIGTRDCSEAIAEAEMGRCSRPALILAASLTALFTIAAASGAALAQSGAQATGPQPGASQAPPGSGSAPASGTGSAPSDGQPAAGGDRQGSAGGEGDQAVPGCPARTNKLDLIV